MTVLPQSFCVTDLRDVEVLNFVQAHQLGSFIHNRHSISAPGTLREAKVNRAASALEEIHHFGFLGGHKPMVIRYIYFNVAGTLTRYPAVEAFVLLDKS